VDCIVWKSLEMKNKKLTDQQGFTLIELLIGVAIMGILVMIAYPSYQDSIRSSRRADGIAAALAVQVAQERFRGSCRFYASNIGASDICGASAAASTVAGPSASNEGFYQLSIEGTASGNAYTILISPTGSQTEDTECSPMRLAFSNVNPTGLKSPADCW